MDFVNQHKIILSHIQYFLDNQFILYGKCVSNILNCEIVEKIKFYNPNITSEKFMNEHIIRFMKLSNSLQSFGLIKDKKKQKDYITIRIDDNTYELSFRYSQPKDNINNKLLISANGIYTNKEGPISTCLKLLKIYKNRKDNKISSRLDWIDILTGYGNLIYGSWISRYISSKYVKELCEDRDIDVKSSANTIKLFKTMTNNGICTNLVTTNKCDYNQYKVKMKDIIFDLHDMIKIDSDAFYNNLVASEKYITTNVIPSDLLFIESLAITMYDIIHKQYTLIKPFLTPTQLEQEKKTKSKLRLLYKPILMENEGFTIKYDYLIYAKITYSELKNTKSDNICKKKKCLHLQKDIDSKIILNIDNTPTCMTCFKKGFP